MARRNASEVPVPDEVGGVCNDFVQGRLGFDLEGSRRR